MDTIEHQGFMFKVELVPDSDHGAPWDEEDGHGVISAWTTRDKKPGERVLNADRSSKRYYDFAATIEIAKRDGWDAKPYGGTKGEKAARAVEADFQRMRAWCNDQWCYVGIVVTLVNDEGEDMGEPSQSLWGIESDCSDYHKEVARELAEEIIAILDSKAA